MGLNVALVRFIHPAHRLGYGIGISAVVIAVSAASGPAIASAILAVLPWPWLFAVNVPIGVAAVAIGSYALPSSPRSGHRFDIVSTVLSAIAFGTLIALIDTIGHDGPPILVAAELAVTSIFGFLLCRRQVSMPLPLLPIDLLRIPIFALSIVTCACSFAAQMLALVALPFHLQAIGYSAVETGLLITPWPLATAVMAPISGRLSDRYPAGLLGLLGLAAFAAGLAGLALLPARAGTAGHRVAHGARGRGLRPLSIAQQPRDAGVGAASPQRRRFRPPEHGAASRTNHRRRADRASVQPPRRRWGDCRDLAGRRLWCARRYRQRDPAYRSAASQRDEGPEAFSGEVRSRFAVENATIQMALASAIEEF